MAKRAAESWKQALIEGRHWREKDARAALAACDKSGESVTSFARRHGVPLHRLWWWRKRLRQPAGDDAVSQRTHKPKRLGVGADVTQAPLAPLLPVTMRLAMGRFVVAVTVGDVRVEVAEPNAVPPEWVGELVTMLQEQDR